jgi:hypothetical protein
VETRATRKRNCRFDHVLWGMRGCFLRKWVWALVMEVMQLDPMSNSLVVARLTMSLLVVGNLGPPDPLDGCRQEAAADSMYLS